MRYTVYGIRLRGTIDVRYIGQTGQEISRRLTSHYGELLCQYGTKTPFAEWALGNRADIEVFAISEHSTRAAAKEAERAAIKLACALGHKLFNQNFVPSALRIVRRPGLAA